MSSLFDERASNSCTVMDGRRQESRDFQRVGHLVLSLGTQVRSGIEQRIFQAFLHCVCEHFQHLQLEIRDVDQLEIVVIWSVWPKTSTGGSPDKDSEKQKKLHRDWDLLVTREISTFFFQFGTWKMCNKIQWLRVDARDHLLEDSNTCFLRFDFLLGGIVCNSASRGTTMCNCMPLWATPSWYAFCKKLNCLQFAMCNSQLTHSYSWAHSKFTEHTVNCVWFTVCFRKITIMPVIANELVEIVPIFLIINKWHY